MSNQASTNGWRVCSISEIAELSNGGTPSKGNEAFWKNGTVPFVTAADLTNLYVSKGRSALTEVGLNSGKTAICEPGDLLIGTRTRVGNCSIAKTRMGASQDITRARLNEGCLPEFFRYYFAHVANELAFYSQGTSIQGITRETLDELEIPVPPLVEQRRIVVRVEALTHRLNQAHQARQSALAEAERVMQATVDSAFSERSSAWETDTLEALCGKPQYGYTESASAAPIGPRFVRITDIQGGRVNWETVPYCECDELDKYRLQTGDILFARTGATTGKSYLVKDPPEAVFASYLIRVRRGQRILPEFLWWYFQSSNYWHAVFSGTEDGNRPNMNGSKLAGLEVPFPNSLETQKQIIKRLDAIRLKVSELQQLQSETEAELASFTPALLAKAFRGEL